jgi:prepilin-type processing-associated H-X9-DG protein
MHPRTMPNVDPSCRNKTDSRKIPTSARGGWTLWDLLATLAVVALIGVMALAAAEENRAEAMKRQCQDNLGVLAKAAHQYAGDFKDRFFYHWPRFALEKEGEPPAGWWYDDLRAGRYLPKVEREPMNFLGGEMAQKYQDRQLLIRGPMTCPTFADMQADVKRSYGMNFWASGVDEKVQVPFYLPNRFNPEDKKPTGQIFRASTPKLDQLLLFADAITDLQQDGYGSMRPPTFRWAGARSRQGYAMTGLPDLGLDPSGQPIPTWLIDYSRHGDNPYRSIPKGKANLALADGHVALFDIYDLYNKDDIRSTYTVLWSPIDREVDEGWLPQALQDLPRSGMDVQG